jgi:uncharacterized protein YndB with AHSA1/START domain
MKRKDIRMADILHEVTIAAKPEAVYAALTEQAGLSAWWTTRAKAEARVGSVSEFGFEGGQMLFRMRVDQLEPGHKVYWTPEQGAPDWGGTRVTWDLTAVEAGTKVLLGHRGYASTEGSFASVSYIWAWYLTSLKLYLESGKGTPNTN